tara:strand:- start:5375 stop:5713 length:339 start_codon:yes stop_codon:yes gene_type:complete
MPNGNNTTEWVTKLQDALNQLQLSSASVELKIDQLKDSVEKLDIAMQELKSITNNQETRVVLLEEKTARIPELLGEDLALIKAQLKTYQRFLWLVAGSVVGLALKMTLGSVG